MKKAVLFSAQIFLVIPESTSNVDIATKVAKYAESQLTKFCTRLENHYEDTGAQDVELLLAIQYL